MTNTSSATRTIRDPDTGEEVSGEEFMRRSRERCANDNERNRLATVYLVDADSYAHHQLWVDHSEEAKARGWGARDWPRVPWEHISLGYGHEVGTFGGMPVFVAISFARVKGHVIAFYEGTSQVVDHRMIEKWLKTEFPASIGKTNATNFHNCLLDLDRVKR